MPVELRMLTFYQDTETDLNSPRRSNVSSAKSSCYDESFIKKSMTSEVQAKAGRGENKVFKPFKQEKAGKHREFMSNDDEEAATEEETDIRDEYGEENQAEAAKNYNSFFMTQVNRLTAE